MIKQLSIQYEEFDHYTELSVEEKHLVEKAYQVCDKAYAPYSEFKVGAAILLENNEIIVGNNQENSAYPSGLCAERVALFYAGANFPETSIQTIVVVAKGELLSNEQHLSPCGSCRQVMSESEKRQNSPIKVILVSQNGKVVVFSSIMDLLPFAFGNLKYNFDYLS